MSRAVVAARLSLLAVLTACGGPPEGIPDSPGTIDAATLADLVTVGTPDLPMLLWLTARGLGDETWRACPMVSVDATSISIRGNDCVDSSGLQWFGSATVNIDPTDARETVTLRDFGADDGVGGWMADGQVLVDLSTTGYLLSTRASVVSLANGESRLMWANTDSAYAYYEGIFYADRHDGTVGLEGWGTADVTTRNTVVGFLYDCGWAAHPAGRMAFGGTNEAFVQYYTGPLDIAAPPPPADTGGSDTGGPADSGDTGGGADDTGGLDIPDFGDGDDADGTCGTCRDAEISGVSLAECLDLERTFSWPFPAPF